MATADRSAPFRRAGSLLALLGLELAAVVGLHWLGRFSGLRIPWDRPVAWLLSSPLQEVLGAILRMVLLVMAYWLLASTLVYLVASLSRLPAALRALRWVTLPLVRRVADHAVAVTLATSMVGGGTVALAGPAGAAPSRGGGPSLGPPARGPVAAAPATGAAARRLLAQPTETSAGQPATSNWRPRTATREPDSTADRPAPSKWRPRTAQAPESNAPQEPDGAAEPRAEEGGAQQSSTTAAQASSTTAAEPSSTTTTTAPSTTTTQPPSTTTTTTRPPTTTQLPTTTAPQLPTTTAPQAPSTTAPQAPSTTAPQAPGDAAEAPGDAAQADGSASGDAQRSDSQEEPEWRPETAGNGGESERGEDSSGTTPGERSRDQTSQPATQAEPYKVKRGDNLWMIARDKLARDGPKSAGELTEKEIADYWVEVVKAFRDEFPSRDPNLIYTTDTIQLPPIGGSGS